MKLQMKHLRHLVVTPLGLTLTHLLGLGKDLEVSVQKGKWETRESAGMIPSNSRSFYKTRKQKERAVCITPLLGFWFFLV